MEPLLTYKTASKVLDCSPSKVQKMCLAGEIETMKLGNETRIHPDALKAWMETSREKCRKDKHSEPIPTEQEIYGIRSFC